MEEIGAKKDHDYKNNYVQPEKDFRDKNMTKEIKIWIAESLVFPNSYLYGPWEKRIEKKIMLLSYGCDGKF